MNITLEALTLLVIRRRSGELIRLGSGQSFALPHEEAQSLLEKAPHKVRIVHSGEVGRGKAEPAMKPEGSPLPTTEELADPASQPAPCQLCRETHFWCATCPPNGHWVCSCDHPRMAISMRQGKAMPEGLTPGQPVSWDSPLFGVLSGVYLRSVGRYQVAVRHPLAEREAVIPAAWLVTTEGKKS